MIGVLIKDYKSKNNEYVYGFVHRRIKGYQENGEECKVFVPSTEREPYSYNYDSVEVVVDTPRECAHQIDANKYRTLVVHFLNKPLIQTLEYMKSKPNVFLYAHGTESLYWYERLFKGVLKNNNWAHFSKECISNHMHMRRTRSLIKRHPEYRFITVSEWMRDKAAKNWKVDSRLWSVIPNFIDEELYQYVPKQVGQRFNLLTIRSFATPKYANDITIELINRLQKYGWFHKLNIKIIGDGVLFDGLIRKLQKKDNIIVEKSFLAQEDIQKYHQEYGVFLCPTRQDAQGVSMCEAMCSGLIPITLDNTAIPEFLPDRRLACKNLDEMEILVKQIIENPIEFSKISKKCSDYIVDKCGYNSTIMKELELFKI